MVLVRSSVSILRRSPSVVCLLQKRKLCSQDFAVATSNPDASSLRVGRMGALRVETGHLHIASRCGTTGRARIYVLFSRIESSSFAITLCCTIVLIFGDTLNIICR